MELRGPGPLAGGQHRAASAGPAPDPGAAHPGNVDTVLVAGRVLKRGGRLLR
ncbi:hypothetical protein [Saccharopolyspora taberi]|uniref:hypothetical protein n=1 Tax=Saccharopolyspora taberi TaxID=60895 RepID=UPI0031D9E4A3